MPNLAARRVVDAILTSHVQGYRQGSLVGETLFPRVPVNVSGGKILTFGKEEFQQYAMRRAPGGATKRIEIGYAGESYSTVEDSLEAKVPREHMRDASQVPGIDLATASINTVMKIVLLGLERDQAALALDAAKYDNDHKVTLANGTKWSADTGKPLSDISDGKEAVRASTGQDPNTLVLSPLAWRAAQNNPQVTERFKYTQSGPITLAQFAALCEVENVAVGKAVAADAAGAFSDIWGNNAVLAYVAPGPSTQAEPSYGYTYTLTGNPLVEKPYWEENCKSWIYGVTFERAPVLSGITAGYLIQNPN